MKEPPQDVTEEELNQYSEGVKKRIQHFSKGYHEERRAKEAAQREKDEALRAAQAIAEENKRLKGSHNEAQAALLEQARQVAAAINRVRSLVVVGAVGGRVDFVTDQTR